jgi:Protein of unknown function (DUF998)
MVSSSRLALSARARSPVGSRSAHPWAARVAVGAIGGYQVLSAAMLLLRPDLDPARKPISEYAIGRLGWVMVGAFLLSALSYGCLLAAVRPLLVSRTGRLGAAILLVCTIGTVGVGVLVADPITTPMTSLTLRGLFHVVFGTTALLLLPFGALLINRDLARAASLSDQARRVLRLAGWVPMIGLGAFLVMMAVVVPAEGWPPRFLFLTYSVWAVLLGHRISSAERLSATVRSTKGRTS